MKQFVKYIKNKDNNEMTNLYFFIENDQFIFDQIKIQPPYLFSTKIGLVNTQKRPHYNTLF
jgi:hypothetical protein